MLFMGLSPFTAHNEKDHQMWLVDQGYDQLLGVKSRLGSTIRCKVNGNNEPAEVIHALM